MHYETLLRRPLAILRRRPWLIALALLAGEFGGGGGSLNFRTTARQLPATPDLAWIPYWINDRLGLLVGIAVALLLTYLALLVISCVAAGAIVRAVDVMDSGQAIRFREAWRAGLGSFWRVLGLRIVLALLLLGPLLLLVIPPAVGAASGQEGLIKGFLIDIPFLFAYVLWALFVSWVAILALRACVLGGRGPISAFGAGCALLRDQFHRVALTGAIFVGVSLVAGIFTGALLAAFSVPFAFSLIRAFQAGDWSSLLGTAVLYLAISIPLSLVINALTGAYYSTFWTLAYRRFAAAGELSGQLAVPRSGEIADPPPLSA